MKRRTSLKKLRSWNGRLRDGTQRGGWPRRIRKRLTINGARGRASRMLRREGNKGAGEEEGEVEGGRRNIGWHESTRLAREGSDDGIVDCETSRRDASFGCRISPRRGDKSGRYWQRLAIIAPTSAREGRVGDGCAKKRPSRARGDSREGEITTAKARLCRSRARRMISRQRYTRRATKSPMGSSCIPHGAI
jgi:hypothetical protein